MIKYLVLLLASVNCNAYEGTFFKYGVGLNEDIKTVKTFTLGYQAPLFAIFDYQLEGGMFNDSKQTQGLIAFSNVSIGVSTFTTSGIYAKIFFGPALISQTDTRLSSIFEFNHDLEFGFVDKKGLSIGVNYKHMSNAGIVLPNYGRDLLLLKIQFPW